MYLETGHGRLSAFLGDCEVQLGEHSGLCERNTMRCRQITRQCVCGGWVGWKIGGTSVGTSMHGSTRENRLEEFRREIQSQPWELP
jgi:hypothetical protein